MLNLLGGFIFSYMKVNSQSHKIVVTGPESSGKTTLAKQLAKQLSIPWIPEYARNYLEKIGRPYQLEDIQSIGRHQQAQHEFMLAQEPEFLICDTSFLVLKIWAEVKYGQKNDWLEKQFQEDQVSLYLLCEPDIPWTYDPLRENPDDRYGLFKRYQSALEIHEKPFSIIKGFDPKQRLILAEQAVRKLSK